MATPTVSSFVGTVIIHPIVVAINNLVLASLMSYITVCVTCDILAVGVDHYKDQEVTISACGAAVVKRFASLFYLARMFLVLNASLLVLALCQSSPKMIIVTAVFTTPAFLSPLDSRRIGAVLQRFIPAKHGQEVVDSSSISGAPFIIKRVPGMKAIFNGILRGYVLSYPDGLSVNSSCGILFVPHSALQASWKSDFKALPWTIIQIIIWSTVNRIGHSIMTDVRDFDEDEKAGVPTIPVLLGSPLKTRIVLTIIQAAVMIAFVGNTYILGSFVIALVWILGKDSPKVYLFRPQPSLTVNIHCYVRRHKKLVSLDCC
ncbi:hypothetical protein EV702DRAFT_1267298 [Suillus placidus]|uniref:Uncharacterized protein n=1 Tax=Suillus placidus TaxID=48579 RepID=A0A9P7A0H8_9AGAM|nr:hypothetical protein EV702DRAFT_1267298 [Suillus placidus]